MKYLKYVLLLVFIFTPFFVWAQNNKQDVIFQAEVTKILAEQDTKLPDGKIVHQQDLKLKGLDRGFQEKDINFFGIGSFDVVKKNIYKVGDKVFVVASYDDAGKVAYYITDYIRGPNLTWLFVIFVLVLLMVGRSKGLRALLSLFLSFVVIVKYIIPQILDGADAVIVTVIGSFLILLIVVYLTEGFNKKSNIATLSIFLSLLSTVFLAWLFVELAKLSGLAGENVSFLMNLHNVTIDFKGLLLAGIIIGTLGVLDDVVISQIATVEQLYKADKFQSKKEVYKKAYEVGISHISSMANTLFLAYAGASFPLLILFVSGESSFVGFGDVVNNEAIATEIVRTLAGSIGLILAVPLATYLGVLFLKEKK